MSNNIKQLSGSIELRVTKQEQIAVAPNPDFFVTEEEQKAEVNGKTVNLYKS